MIVYSHFNHSLPTFSFAQGGHACGCRLHGESCPCHYQFPRSQPDILMVGMLEPNDLHCTDPPLTSLQSESIHETVQPIPIVKDPVKSSSRFCKTTVPLSPSTSKSSARFLALCLNTYMLRASLPAAHPLSCRISVQTK
jgi:hypothetical protein